MKIIYLYRRSGNVPGVDKKVLEKSIHFQKQHKNFLLLIAGNVEFKSDLNVKTDYIPIINLNDFVTISNYLETIKEQFVIVMRYNWASYAFLDFAKKWGKHIFVEHNSIEENELQSLIKKHNFRDFIYLIRKGKIKEYLDRKRQVIIEKNVGKQILSFIKGGICVTNEIARYECSRYNNYHTFISANPIPNLNNSQFKSKKISTPIKVVFIAGGAYHWHGLERWLLSLKKIENKKQIQTFIVGNVTTQNKSLIKTMQQDGYLLEKINHLNTNELGVFFADKHLGIGSLGLYKNNMNEACTLKTREYLANALPVLIGYLDTDFSQPQFTQYVYHVPNNESTFEIQPIIDWLNNFYKNPEHIVVLKSILEQYTFSTKISKMLQFITSK